MYKPVQAGDRGRVVVIFMLAAIFIVFGCSISYAATQSKESDQIFKSEADLINETRQAVESHLNDKDEVRIKPKEESAQAVVEEPAKEETIIPEEEPDKPLEAEASAQTESKPATVEEKQSAAEDDPAGIEAKTAVDQTQPAADNSAPTAESADQPSQQTADNTAAQDGSNFVEEKGILPSDVTPVAVTDIKKPIAEEIDITKQGKIIEKPAVEQPILRKMDVNKIGSSPYYETYEGLRLLKYFTVAQRVEIYQEPKPIDSYILDAHAMRYLYGIPWDAKADYRTQLVPTFTRAYGTEITMSDPKNKEAQLRYTLDYRDIYKNYWPKYPELRKESWDQNELLLMHSKVIEPINWLYTSNLGYRFSTMSAKSDAPFYSYYEIRSTYFGSLSLAPTDRVEYFLQGEYYKSSHVKCSWAYNPDHFMGRGEIRIKSKDYKTMYVPSFSFSKDLYYPFANSFEKYEIAFRVGRDWTKRFSSAHTLQYVLSSRDEPDNVAPLYTPGYSNPIKDKAEYISFQNRLSYNLYDRLYLQTGLDLSNGINWSVFDNVGFLGGIEYYAPGMIRVDVGWRGNYYYNLFDCVSSIYFKVYFFM